MGRSKYKTGLRLAGATILILTCVGRVLSQAPAATEVVEHKFDNRSHTSWSKGLITVTGWGPKQERLPKPLQPAAQRRVAIADAYRMMVETVHGVHVTSETTVEKYELVSDTIKATVQGMCQGARVMSEGYTDDTKDIYQVTMALAITPQAGFQTSLAEVIVPTVPTLEAKAMEAARKPPATGTGTTGPTDVVIKPSLPKLDIPRVQPPPAVALPARKAGPYTGVVIDASGFELVRCMCPKIFRKSGAEVWGTVHVDADFVNRVGIAGFAPSLEMILTNPCRVSGNPLIIRAIGRQGSAFANAVVDDDDAELIAAENAKSKFLDAFKVMFVVSQ